MHITNSCMGSAIAQIDCLLISDDRPACQRTLKRTFNITVACLYYTLTCMHLDKFGFY